MHAAELRSHEEEEKLTLRLTRQTSGKWMDDYEETPSLILDRLYLGSVRDAKNLGKLQTLKITHVLNLANELYISAELFDANSLTINYLGITAHDTEAYPIHEHFDETFQFIHSALQTGGIILVHCAAGVSRSAAIICAYLMKSQRWSCEKAVLFVNSRRACASPNRGFMRSLLRYEARENLPPSSSSSSSKEEEQQ